MLIGGLRHQFHYSIGTQHLDGDFGGLRHQFHYSIGTQHLDGDCFHKR